MRKSAKRIGDVMYDQYKKLLELELGSVPETVRGEFSKLRDCATRCLNKIRLERLPNTDRVVIDTTAMLEKLAGMLLGGMEAEGKAKVGTKPTPKPEAKPEVRKVEQQQPAAAAVKELPKKELPKKELLRRKEAEDKKVASIREARMGDRRSHKTTHLPTARRVSSTTSQEEKKDNPSKKTYTVILQDGSTLLDFVLQSLTQRDAVRRGLEQAQARGYKSAKVWRVYKEDLHKFECSED